MHERQTATHPGKSATQEKSLTIGKRQSYDRFDMLRLTLAVLLFAALCPAQNADLSVLFSVRQSTYEFGSPPNNFRLTSNAVYIDLVGAIQVYERGRHRLYLGVSVTPGLNTVAQVISSVTAGPRYQYELSPRWSTYAMVEAGASWIERGPILNSHTDTSPLIGYRGGLSFRLSKLMSLRGELRQAVRLGNVPSRQFELSPSFGLGVHF